MKITAMLLSASLAASYLSQGAYAQENEAQESLVSEDIQQAYQQFVADWDALLESEEEDFRTFYNIVYSLYQDGQYQIAYIASTELLTVFPDNETAIATELQLREKVQEEGLPFLNALDFTTTDIVSEPQWPALNKEQLNLLYVYEMLDVAEGERPPRIDIDRDVTEAFFEAFEGADELSEFRGRRGLSQFRRLSGYEQLTYFFALEARQFYSQVEVRDVPEPLEEFRGLIYRNDISRNFARVFGEGQIPVVHLHAQRTANEEVAMANFLILTTAEHNGLPFIDRDPQRVDGSLLLQWGLPREDAEYPAPQVEGWEPWYRDTEDKAYVEMREWILSLYDYNGSGPEYQGMEALATQDVEADADE